MIARVAPVLRLALLAAALFVELAAPRPALAERPERALCIVCRVEEGTTDPEEVRAVREHGGREYTFCSDRCAKKFDETPHRYIDAAAAPPAPAGSDSLFALTLPGGERVSTAPT
jgi:YHS domain-containing protein